MGRVGPDFTQKEREALAPGRGRLAGRGAGPRSVAEISGLSKTQGLHGPTGLLSADGHTFHSQAAFPHLEAICSSCHQMSELQQRA